MSKGAEKNYKESRQKNHWRRWQWNRIEENLRKTKRRTQDAMVLYLAGKDNLDKPVALAHGFRPENLIAVECDDIAVESLKSDGTLTVEARLNQAVMAWTNSRNIDVIVADFCFGLVREALEFCAILTFHPAVKNCVLAANFQRGRDGESNYLREFLKEKASLVAKDKALFERDDLDKHRGYQFYVMAWRHFWNRQTGALKTKFSDQGPDFFERVRAKNEAYADHMGDVSFNSYASITKSESGKKTTVFYDSVVFRPPSGLSYAEFITNQNLDVSIKDLRTYKTANDEWQSRYGQISRSITANLAVRTRRINAFASN